MDIEQIEKMLSEIAARLEWGGQDRFMCILHLQCQLLLHFYKKLESIDDTLASIDREIFSHLNK